MDGISSGPRFQFHDLLWPHLDTFTDNPSPTVAPNGNGAVNFDGNDYLRTTHDFDSLSAYTIFTVARYTGGDNERVISSFTRNWLFGFHGNSDDRWHAEGWIFQGSGVSTNWIIHAGHINNDADPKASFWRNGILRVANNTGSNNSNSLRLASDWGL